MASVRKLAISASLLLSATAQFVTPPTDLKNITGYLDLPVRYKQVPDGICETTPGVKSFSGYVDLAEDAHIFFWFFEARNGDPMNSPLTIYLSGGPGTSSMYGLFGINGPCNVDYDGNLHNNPYSWSNATNIIYIDQPLTVGFSYTKAIPAYVSANMDTIGLPDNSCPDWVINKETCGTWSIQQDTLTSNSTPNAAHEYWRALQGFMGAFPQYSKNGVHFASESYGGQWGSVFNAYVVDQNRRLSNGTLNETHAQHIDLRSVMINNGWYDPIIQYQAYYNYTVSPGNTYDVRPFNESIEQQMYNALYGPSNCVDQLVQCAELGWNELCEDATNYCVNEVETFLAIAQRSEYDIRYADFYFPPNTFPPYLNKPNVQAAIGAYTNFSTSLAAESMTINDVFGDTGDVARSNGAVGHLRSLVEAGVYVLLWAGDADYNCNWLGGQKVAEMVKASGFEDAGFVNISTSDSVVHGQVKQSDNFAFARIYQAGHSVPYYQPLAALEILKRVLNATDVVNGQHGIRLGGTYRTVGTAQSTYREGNSTVIWHPLGPDPTYNSTTNLPNPQGANSSISSGLNAHHS